MSSKVEQALRAEADQRFLALYEQLNEQQKAAVDHVEGPLMVLAGPGTGKTQLVAMRIAKILRETQMDPWNILCVTFTESGVQAMRERLHQIIGTPAYYVRIHTFHSFCNEVIQEQPEFFVAMQQWQPLADIERIELIESLLDELPGTSPLRPLGAPLLYVRDIISNIQSLKQEAISPVQFEATLQAIATFIAETEVVVEHFNQLKPTQRTDAKCHEFQSILRSIAVRIDLPSSIITAFDRLFASWQERVAVVESQRDASKLRTSYKNDIKRWYDRLRRQLPRQQGLATVYQRYQERLTERRRYDFEDMISFVLQAFEQHDDLLAQYQEQFQYIMVDEYQDTNGAQNELVRLLSSFDVRPNVAVVGDDKQSIYRFQGASMSNMLDFYHRLAGEVQVVSLQENYRSQAMILAAAGSVIAHNEESIVKYIPGATSELRAVAEQVATPVQRIECEAEDAEDFWVAQRIQKLVAAGVVPSSIAVLVRYHRDSERLYSLLRGLGVPVRLEAGEDVLTDLLIQQFLTLLRAIELPERDDLMGEVLHYPWLGFTPVDVLTVLRHAQQERRSIMALLSEGKGVERLSLRSPEQWESWIERVAIWRQRSRSVTLLDFLHTIVSESGFLTFILQQPDHLAVLQKITRLLDEAQRLNRSNREIQIQAFLAAVDRLREHQVPLMTQPWQMTHEAVRIMTAHKAKGLEFEHVFITRLNDKHWGNNPEPQKLSLPHGLVRYDYLVAQENNEDERRLFYVALTRARQQLVVTRSRHNSQGRPTVPSLFWSELPLEVVETQVVVAPEAAATSERLVAQLAPRAPVQQREIVDWVRQQLQDYTLSVTHLNDFLVCQRLFYLRHILRLPAARSPAQALGTAIHGALHDFFVAFTDKGSVPSPVVLEQSFRRYIEREVIAPGVLAQIRDIGVALLASYFERYQTEFIPAVATEYSFGAHGVMVDGISLTGKIDKIELVDKARNTVNVVDFKATSPEGASAKLKAGGAYYRQLVFYKLLGDASPRFPYQVTSGEIDFLQPDDRGRYLKKRLVLSSEDVETVLAEVKAVWQQIQSLSFMDRTQGCGACEACSLQLV